MKLQAPLYTEFRVSGKPLAECENLPNILDEILVQQNKKKSRDDKDKEIASLKNSLFRLQEKLLREIFMRVKAQACFGNQKEVQITFDEAFLLIRIEKVQEADYNDFVQKLFFLLLEGGFEAEHGKKFRDAMGAGKPVCEVRDEVW